MEALTQLDQLLTLGELEAAVCRAEHAAGLTAEVAWRPLFEWELTSRVDFAAIDGDLAAAYARAANVLDGVRDVILEALAAATHGSRTPREIMQALARFAAEQPPAVQAKINAATAQIADVLTDTYERAAGRQVEQARRQGVPVGGGVLDRVKRIVDGIRRRGQYLPTAGTSPLSVWTRLSQAALQVGGSRVVSPTEIVEGAAEAPIEGAYDLSRQAVNVTRGDGLDGALGQLPRPSRVYASELLDRNTCRPCRRIDGEQWLTLDDARTAYPGSGPYRSCQGGDRCRGTLVVVWPEASPAL